MRDVNPIFLDSRLRGSDGKTELVDGLKGGEKNLPFPCIMPIWGIPTLTREDIMNSHFSIVYEVIDPVTQERFITEDRYIAEHHYNEKSCTVYEKHRTDTRLSPFTDAMQQITLCWHDEDSNDINPKTEEI